MQKNKNNNDISMKKVELFYGVINIIEIIVVLVLIFYFKIFSWKIVERENTGHFKWVLAAVGIFLIVNFFIGFKNLKVMKKYLWKIGLQKENIDRIHELNNTLRGQRHDFLNNLQVVYSLMQMEEYDDAQKYIQDVYKDIKKVSRVLRTSNPAINALLQAKIADAEKHGIGVGVNINSRVDQINKEAWEICRVLGNLIDNALYELQSIEIEDKKLNVTINEDLNSYYFIVENNGREIPKNNMDKIFEANFTTKGNRGEGMGLAITKELVHKNKGEISLDSTPQCTSFTVKIPIFRE